MLLLVKIFLVKGWVLILYVAISYDSSMSSNSMLLLVMNLLGKDWILILYVTNYEPSWERLSSNSMLLLVTNLLGKGCGF